VIPMSEHYESLYHCNMCRGVYYLEETDHKLMYTCENCGPSTFFKIEGGNG